MIHNSEFITAFFLVALVSSLLAMSYWAGVSDLEEHSQDEDLFRDF